MLKTIEKYVKKSGLAFRNGYELMANLAYYRFRSGKSGKKER